MPSGRKAGALSEAQKAIIREYYDIEPLWRVRERVGGKQDNISKYANEIGMVGYEMLRKRERRGSERPWEDGGLFNIDKYNALI